MWKKIEFYKGKSGDCICNWSLRQSPGVASGDKTHFFSFLMYLKDD